MIKAYRNRTGFSIVEVLVALVVLAVGMLGIASLYVTTLRSSGSAVSRMQAVNLASDLADRIRANRFARAAYQGAGAAQNCTGTNNCTAEQMAANDVFLWQRQIDDLMPGRDPQGTVVYTAATATVPDIYTITVNWREAIVESGSEETDDGDLRYVLTMQIDP